MRSCFSAGASSLTQVPCEQCVIAATGYTNLGFDISSTAQFCGLILALAVFLSGWPSLCKAVSLQAKYGVVLVVCYQHKASYGNSGVG